MTESNDLHGEVRAAEALFDAVGGIGDDLVADARSVDVRNQKIKTNKKGRFWRILVPAAACFILITGGFFTYLGRMGWLGAGMGSYPGLLTSDGTYYCLVPHDGVYACKDGEAERRVSQFFVEQWAVNDYALYWKSGRSVYVLPHGENRFHKLYTVGASDCSHITFRIEPDGTLAVTVYNKTEKHLREVRVDGITGEETQLLTPTTDYREKDLRYTRTVWTLGERTICLNLLEIEGWGTVGLLYENGQPIYDGPVYVDTYPVELDGALVFFGRQPYDYDNTVYVDTYPVESDGTLVFFGRQPYDYDNNYVCVLRDDGEDSLIRPGNGSYTYWATGDSDKLFCVRNGNVCCADARTGTEYELTSDIPHDFCDLVYDGARELLYACEPWNNTTTLWRVVSENGHPARLVLTDDDLLH